MIEIANLQNNTFVIEVKSTHNNSWQGVLTWVETSEKISFRSALELIRLLDSAVHTQVEDKCK